MTSENRLITKYEDTEKYLLNFLDINTILALSLVSKIENKLLLNTPLFKDIRFLIKRYPKKELTNIIDSASKHGLVSILEWFKNFGYEFKYTKWAIDWAAKNGHDNVLEWFHKAGYEFKYTEDAIDWAARNGH